MVPGTSDKPRDVTQDLPVLIQEGVVGEIVILQPREGAGIVAWRVPPETVRLDAGQRVFPGGPGAGKADLLHRIA